MIETVETNLLRTEIVHYAGSFFRRGFTVGSSGNISVRCKEGYLVTPTNACLGDLVADRISLVSPDGEHLSGETQTKEMPMHMAVYRGRPQTVAVVHLHSTWATLLSALASTDPNNALPPITPYAVMRLGRVPVLPYCRPGGDAVVDHIERAVAHHNAILLANHGPVVAGNTLAAAVFASEELEETAKLVLLAGERRLNLLTQADVAELEQSFNLRG